MLECRGRKIQELETAVCRAHDDATCIGGVANAPDVTFTLAVEDDGRMNDKAQQTGTAACELARTCAASLHSNLHAAVLYGSLTLGDFEPGRSDLDLMLITGPNRLSRANCDRIIEGVSNARVGAARAVDLIVVTSTVAGRPRRAPPSELEIARYPDEMHVTAAKSANDDLIVELSMARETGRSLIGIPADQVIGKVLPLWVKDRGLFWLRRWLTLADDAEHAELMVLTACRIWHFDTESTYCSKPRAGQWALARDPSLTGVTRALRQRRGESDTPIPAEDLTHVLRTVLDEVDTP